MKNKSETLKNWCQQVDNILSDLPAHTVNGMPLNMLMMNFKTACVNYNNVH